LARKRLRRIMPSSAAVRRIAPSSRAALVMVSSPDRRSARCYPLTSASSGTYRDLVRVFVCQKLV
jgi:hypothetical protein